MFYFNFCLLFITVTLSAADSLIEDVTCFMQEGGGFLSNSSWDTELEANHPFSNWPWMVLVPKRNSNLSCGGTILNTDSMRWVLTSANCSSQSLKIINIKFEKFPEENDDHEEYNRDVLVKEVFLHHAYDPQSLKNDIALLLIEKPFKNFWQKVSPVCLPPQLFQNENMNAPVKEGLEVTAIALPANIGGSQNKIFSQADILTHTCGNDLEEHLQNLYNKAFICTSCYEENSPLAQNSDGFPLLKKNNDNGSAYWFQIGISSPPRNGCKRYTKISNFMQWIKRIIGHGQIKSNETYNFATDDEKIVLVWHINFLARSYPNSYSEMYQSRFQFDGLIPDVSNNSGYGYVKKGTSRILIKRYEITNIFSLKCQDGERYCKIYYGHGRDEDKNKQEALRLKTRDSLLTGLSIETYMGTGSVFFQSTYRGKTPNKKVGVLLFPSKCRFALYEGQGDYSSDTYDKKYEDCNIPDSHEVLYTAITFNANTSQIEVTTDINGLCVTLFNKTHRLIDLPNGTQETLAYVFGGRDFTVGLKAGSEIFGLRISERVLTKNEIGSRCKRGWAPPKQAGETTQTPSIPPSQCSGKTAFGKKSMRSLILLVIFIKETIGRLLQA